MVNRTRSIAIAEKIIKADDLRRMVHVFDNQLSVAEETDEYVSGSYEIVFSDSTTLESASPELFTDESLATPGRANAVRMTFVGSKPQRRLDLSLNRGKYGNQAVVSGTDSAWVNDTYLVLKDIIDRIEPQQFWLKRHSITLTILVAAGIGSLVELVFDVLVWWVFHRVKPPEMSAQLRAFFAPLFAPPTIYILRWGWRIILGLIWGAPFISEWFLRLWPNIEFDFGLDHLKVEKTRRKRLAAVVTLIVLPILISLITDRFLK